MAKPLIVEFSGETIHLQLEKVERAKLYGYVETEVVDDSGKSCELATLSSDGHSLVGKGGTALAYFSPDGLWRKKNELRAVDVQGHPIHPVKSSFDSPIPLTKQATIDEYLSHNIHAIYHLTPDEMDSKWLAELKKGAIFQFPFSYRGGLEASAGFLLLGSAGDIFLCVGTPTTAEFVGMQATAPAIPEIEETAAADDDALDFSLV